MPTRIRKETTQRRVDAGGEELCKRLAVTTGTPVLNIERVGYVEDKAVMVKYSHWRHEFVPGPDDEPYTSRILCTRSSSNSSRYPSSAPKRPSRRARRMQRPPKY